MPLTWSSAFVVALGSALPIAAAVGAPSSGPTPPAPVAPAPAGPTAMTLGPVAGQTAVSGNHGGTTWSFGIDGTRGITGLSIGEKSDDPCYMSLEKKDDDDGSDTTSPYTSQCNGGAHSVDLNVSFPNNPRYFVRGISVCLSNSGKVKGVAIVAAKLPAGSSDVEELVDFTSDQLTNCSTWKPWVYCPTNSIAQGMLIEADGDTFVGLALDCDYRS